MSTSSKARREYTIGWICALPKEQTAATSMLDERHPDIVAKSPNDANTYSLGSIGLHNVVITCLPLQCYGTNQTARAAAQMLSTFPSINIILVVGIGAGIPSKVKLGDVVVSTEWVQWDFGKTNKHGVFELTDKRCRPPDGLLSAMSTLQTEHSMQNKTKIPEYLNDLRTNHPHLASQYTSIGNPEEMRVHYGLIASGNQVVKDQNLRDEINSRLNDQVFCIEMEAAGLVGFPAVVVRGICDYADSNKNDDWQEYAAAVAAACAKELLSCLNASAAMEIRIGKEDLDRVIDEIAVLKESLTLNEDLKVLDWITTIDDSLQHNDFFNRRAKGTGQQFLNSPEYQSWLNTAKGILFCQGIPGAGKTILTSVVIDYLIDRYLYNPTVGIAYIYFNSKGSAQLRIDDLLSSLLRQLARTQTSLPKSVRALYRTYRNIRPSRTDIMKTLHAICASYSRVFIIVDALDEYKYEKCSEFLEKLFELYKHGSINIFATSRPIPRIRDIFRENKADRTELEILATDEDIKAYLDKRISQSGSNTVKHSREKIKNEISKRAQGMFLLAHFHYESLKNAISITAIDSALEGFPKQGIASNSLYDAVYEDVMEKIQSYKDKESTNTAFQVLSWITCASKRLTKEELQHAITVKPFESKLNPNNIPDLGDLVSLCLGLVAVDEESDVVRLIHYTAQEYFERTKQIWFPNSHTDIATICTIYLSYDTFNSGPCANDEELLKRLESNVLYRYAASNWAYHIRKSSSDGGNSSELSPKLKGGWCTREVETNSLVVNLLLDDNLRRSCVQFNCFHEVWYINRPNRQIRDKMLWPHVAGYYGLTLAMKTLLEGNASKVHLEDSCGRTALSYAAEEGHDDFVEFLIDKGSDLEAQCQGGKTPLVYAVERGHESVVELLLDKGSNLEAQGRFKRTPLCYAAERGHGNIIELLIKRGADLKPVNGDMLARLSNANIGWVAGAARRLIEGMLGKDAGYEHLYIIMLKSAAKNGWEDIIRALRGRGVDLGMVLEGEKDNDTALSIATKNRQGDAVKVLMEAGVDVEDTRGFCGETALMHAIKCKCEGVVAALLERADVEARDINGMTPLSIAINIGEERIVKLLLEKGAKLGSESLTGALKTGQEGIVRLLVENGADLECRGGRGVHKTALWQALDAKRDGLVEFFVKNKADLEAKNMVRKTPLLHGAETGNAKLVQLLIENGADLEAKDDSGNTSIAIAITNKHDGVVKLLAENGANLEAKCCHGRAPLHWAARGGRKLVVELLLEKKLDPEIKDKSGQTALMLGAGNGHKQVVQLLINSEADFNAKDNSGHTALMLAACNGHEQIVQLLIDSKADIDAKDNYGQTALMWGADNGAKRFILHPRDIKDTTYIYDRTLFRWRVDQGHKQIVQLLIESKAEFDAKGNDGQTALMLAARDGHEETVRLLLDSGADFETKDNNGQTALSLAASRRQGKAVKLLRGLVLKERLYIPPYKKLKFSEIR
ncbi:hypothetical protein TWF694_005334 [Orbilia ellipsospora]|uniref:Nucleoside phosphorylase domain-containing protein n=1 Tax=Orbilia ellipsospora TaxID=2528407 RepID=A0AAV9WYV4_9PEZI